MKLEVIIGCANPREKKHSQKSPLRLAARGIKRKLPATGSSFLAVIDGIDEPLRIVAEMFAEQV